MELGVLKVDFITSENRLIKVSVLKHAFSKICPPWKNQLGERNRIAGEIVAREINLRSRITLIFRPRIPRILTLTRQSQGFFDLEHFRLLFTIRHVLALSRLRCDHFRS